MLHKKLILTGSQSTEGLIESINKADGSIHILWKILEGGNSANFQIVSDSHQEKEEVQAILQLMIDSL